MSWIFGALLAVALVVLLLWVRLTMADNEVIQRELTSLRNELNQLRQQRQRPNIFNDGG